MQAPGGQLARMHYPWQPPPPLVPLRKLTGGGTGRSARHCTTASPDPSVIDEDAAAEAGGVVTAGGPLRSTPLPAR